MEDGEMEDTASSKMRTYRLSRDSSFSDDSSGSDDNELTWKRRKKSSPVLTNELRNIQQTGTNEKKRNNVWGMVLSEQILSENIKDFGVTQTVDKTRTVESYEYRTTANQAVTSHPNRKRKHTNFIFHYSEGETDRDIAGKIAERLKEPKVELIERTVSEIGRKLGIELLRKAEEIEAGGGMMTNIGNRRRTPGGVYLQLLREHPDISKSQRDNIFSEEKKMTDMHKKKKRQKQRRLKKMKEKEIEETSKLPSLPSVIDVAINESDVSELFE